MRVLILSLVLGAGLFAQTPNQVGSCYFPLVGQTTPQYFRITSLASGQCEAVSLDSTVLAVRNTSNNVVVSSLSGSNVPNHVYTTPVQFTLQQSNTNFVDSGPTSPFGGQPVWCFSTSSAAFTTWSGVLGSFLPTALVEVRVRVSPVAGELPQVFTTGVTANAASPTSGGRFMTLKSHSACNGNPGVVWNASAASIPIDTNTIQTTLNAAFLVGIL